jgi:hypothetical protein
VRIQALIKILTVSLSTVLIVETSALATSLMRLPSYITVGMLQSYCEKDDNDQDRANTYLNGMCEGYIQGVVETYFEKVAAKQRRNKLNGCALLFNINNKAITDDIRKEIVAISDGSILNSFHGPSAKTWITTRLANKCEPKK